MKRKYRIRHGSDVSHETRGTVSIPLSAGRIVITPEAVERFGPELLHRLGGFDPDAAKTPTDPGRGHR